MPRWIARLAGLTLALALGSVLALAATTNAVTSRPGTEAPARLTLDGFNKLMKAEQSLQGATRDSNLERALAMHGDPDTILRWQTQLDEDKEFSKTVRAAGLEPREYVRTLVAVLQAYAVSGLQKQGKTIPDKLMSQVPAENIAFVDQHAPEIEAWAARSGRTSVKPNTMEDVYVDQQSPSPDAAKTANTTDAAAAPPAPKPAAGAASKKPAKDAAKSAPKTGGDKP